MTQDQKRITIAYGDGIGPEIMEATLKILKAAQARLSFDVIEIGEQVYKKGLTSGIAQEAWDIVKRNKIFLKAPITTPQGGGYKSLNVTFRKALGLFANIRPAISYAPFVKALHPIMDLVVVRENEEDLYAGIEYMFNSEFAVSYKVITHKGCSRIIKYAFEYARQNNRKKVTALVKDNIMKISDGMFHNVFNEIAAEYPDIESNAMIVDIGSARIASRPGDFDVIVTLNLYGDIVSDIASDVSGSVGLAGSANIGNDFAMFEAVHGSAPDIAGKAIANPSGLLNGAIMMLEHIGQGDVAANIKNAWLKTIEDGIHTKDIYNENNSKRLVSTIEFADAVIANLSKMPATLKPALAGGSKQIDLAPVTTKAIESKFIGIDVYINTHAIDSNPDDINVIGAAINQITKEHNKFMLQMISHRGIKVWPDSNVISNDLDVVRCRFIGFQDANACQQSAIELLALLDKANFEIANVVRLNTYNDKPGFTLAQGQ